VLLLSECLFQIHSYCHSFIDTINESNCQKLHGQHWERFGDFLSCLRRKAKIISLLAPL